MNLSQTRNILRRPLPFSYSWVTNAAHADANARCCQRKVLMNTKTPVSGLKSSAAATRGIHSVATRTPRIYTHARVCGVGVGVGVGGRGGSVGSNSRRCRGFHSTAAASHGGIERPEPGTGITIHFKDSKGNLIKTVEANEGDDILSVAHEYDIDLEGACEGSIACSTCHIILPPSHYSLLPEPSDDENDMLDMAFGLTDTSRLGCQVVLTKELDGMEVALPSATRNMFVDGKKPSH